MISPVSFLSTVFFFMVAFFFQQAGVFVVHGIQPNFILVGLVFLAVRVPERKIFISFIIVLGIFILLLTPYWIQPILLMFMYAVGFYFLKDMVTGNAFFDFMVGIFLGILFLYSVTSFLNAPFIALPLLLGEIAYTFLVGVLVWFLLKKKEIIF